MKPEPLKGKRDTRCDLCDDATTIFYQKDIKAAVEWLRNAIREDAAQFNGTLYCLFEDVEKQINKAFEDVMG